MAGLIRELYTWAKKVGPLTDALYQAWKLDSKGRIQSRYNFRCVVEEDGILSLGVCGARALRFDIDRDGRIYMPGDASKCITVGGDGEVQRFSIQPCLELGNRYQTFYYVGF